MKYTRVKAVTCAITASVMLFGSAAQIQASGVSYELPAAGVGLVLDEGSSLSSVQERADRAAEAVAEAQKHAEVTFADIESGVIGVGEYSIDINVVAHVQQQQMETAISNGIGVAGVLSTPVETEEKAAETAPVFLAAGEEAAVGVQTDDTAAQEAGQTGIVEPVELKDMQNSPDAESGVIQTEAAEEKTEQKTEVKEAEPEQKADESIASDKKEEKEQAADEKELTADQTAEPEQPAQDTEETENARAAADSSEETAAGETEVPEASAPEAEAAAIQEAPAPAVSTEPAAPAVSAEPAAPAVSAEPAATAAGSAVAQFAVQFVGNPYVYGGTSLTNGADCSGFVMSVYNNFGVSLPHSSSGDRKVGTDVGGIENAQPGDIVCYSGHVGIYIGNGQIVHASTESTGIKISDANYRTPVCVRRIFN